MLAALITGLTLAAAPHEDDAGAAPTSFTEAHVDDARTVADDAGHDAGHDDRHDDQDVDDDEHESEHEGDDDGQGDGHDGHDEHEGADDDERGEGRSRARKLPRPDGGKRSRKDGNDDASAIFVDSAIGCGLGGALPALGTTTGLGLFYGSMLGGNACGSVAGFVGGVSGALVAIPSVLLLGPCAAGGATCGAALGAATSDKDIGRAVQWSLPGLGVGLLGGGVATAGLLVSSSTNAEIRDWAMPVGTTLVVVGTLLASAGGPLSAAGATLLQADDPDSGDDVTRRAPRKPLRDGGLEARAGGRDDVVAERDGVDVAMAW